MRRRKRLVAAAVAGLVPVFSLVSAEPAAAYYQVVSTRDFTFRYQGQQLTCTVRGTTGVNPDDYYIEFGVTTEMVDDDPRCREAIAGVSTGLSWLHPGAEEIERESVRSFELGPSDHLTAYLQDVESAQVNHEFHFDCDNPEPASHCNFNFYLHVYPK
jgi:hypothetical protein